MLRNDELENMYDEYVESSSSSNSGLDTDGSESFNEELESSELEEGNDDEESSVNDGFDDDSNVSIDYVKLTASVREAQMVNTIDSDLNELPLSDVLMLILALVLGIILIRLRR